MKELVPELLRELNVHLRDHPHGKAWLSAASGLVCAGDKAYVIADDEHHLGCFALDSSCNTADAAPLELIRLFAGDLPRDKGKRKKAKPDLESLSLLPALPDFPYGALLAMGSGSKETRYQAVLMPFDHNGALLADIRRLDLRALYEPLEQHFDDLNIEGAFVTGGEFHLLQRGNKSKQHSARITYHWPAVAGWLKEEGIAAPVAASIHELDIGSVDGVPLSITDAAALHAGWWVFCAVAENTEDSYQDGACLASMVGIVNPEGKVAGKYFLHGRPKVEGIAVVNTGAGIGRGAGQVGTREQTGIGAEQIEDASADEPRGEASGLQLLLVTDADDPKIASQLLRVTLPLT
ncbi:MAG: hypothetical protein V4628_01350 [Pseudomonadota bacterium]